MVFGGGVKVVQHQQGKYFLVDLKSVLLKSQCMSITCQADNMKIFLTRIGLSKRDTPINRSFSCDVIAAMLEDGNKRFLISFYC